MISDRQKKPSVTRSFDRLLPASVLSRQRSLLEIAHFSRNEVALGNPYWTLIGRTPKSQQ